MRRIGSASMLHGYSVLCSVPVP
ncbi:hypothetical protein A2U01_0085745, partial [Trifolium medium]|nr:hypothetical protein [Trifolium medium]